MQHQVSRKTIGKRNGYLSALEFRKFEDTTTMRDWHNEWATAPNDPLPSKLKLLKLLNKPAKINTKNHAVQAREVALIHYDVNLIPEGRAQQEQQRYWLREERRLKRDAEAFVSEMERVESRQKVMTAAKVAEVIDLTEDEMVSKPASQNVPVNVATHQDFSGLPFGPDFRHDPVASYPSGTLDKAPWRPSKQTAPQRRRPYRIQKKIDEPSRFTQHPSFQKIPAHGTLCQFPRPPYPHGLSPEGSFTQQQRYNIGPSGFNINAYGPC
ncbi:hypothetical protein CC86DRAFT_413509 [Ophiobolus disseminans]|uniref:Uncharacterized protein n=1 Tax=Ophiobolus disseminans TaxID=1469910 RepID=A0A6A6ZF84_9PLEO|nr:hypothetical protein CC86DRAFT_413509 [Ophiobolus disseminans]